MHSAEWWKKNITEMITEQILSIIEMEFGNSNEIHVFGAYLLLWTQLGLARVFFFRLEQL